VTPAIARATGADASTDTGGRRKIPNEGSILLLTPRTELARNWIDEHIGRANGFQPYYPAIVIEPRYVIAILKGIRVAGLEIES
jgi:hypothetical protein